MKTSIDVEIIADIPLTVVCVQGAIDEKMPITFIDRINSHDGFDPNINILFDFRNVVLEMEIPSLKGVAGDFLNHPVYSGNRKEVYLIESNRELAKLSVFSMHARSRKIEFNVEFSLREALVFLEIDQNFSPLIESALERLRDR